MYEDFYRYLGADGKYRWTKRYTKAGDRYVHQRKVLHYYNYRERMEHFRELAIAREDEIKKLKAARPPKPWEWLLVGMSLGWIIVAVAMNIF